MWRVSLQGQPHVVQPGAQQQRLRPLLRDGQLFTRKVPDVSAVETEGRAALNWAWTHEARAPSGGEGTAITNCEHGFWKSFLERVKTEEKVVFTAIFRHFLSIFINDLSEDIIYSF